LIIKESKQHIFLRTLFYQRKKLKVLEKEKDFGWSTLREYHVWDL